MSNKENNSILKMPSLSSISFDFLENTHSNYSYQLSQIQKIQDSSVQTTECLLKPLDCSSCPWFDSLKFQEINLSSFVASSSHELSYSQLFFQSIETIDLLKLQEQQKSMSPSPGFEQIQKSFTPKSKVLYIRGIDHPSLTITQMRNILRNFGLLEKILFFKSKGALLAEFKHLADATHCKQGLDGVRLMGNEIKVFWSHHNSIENKFSFESEFWQNTTTPSIKNICNSPSLTIHVSNLPKQLCTQQQIKLLFQSTGEIIKIKFLLNQSQTNMCLVEFTKIEESINTVAFFHQSEFLGKKINVSFSQSKI